ncbi:DNA gyrase subunit A [Methanofollis aquaemaris]|uniref:DNA gyrase subunit A n=1 Tax=Methanofollis aquaemaris TaxID=126734 RepID=A0A8A3S2Z6_9EURY|nr:DNA gyrase subunit A [Methanofollis aquaemaris]QSZ66647.1 DNA gyrase subunit A [Methanofollis aquaemaris]
MTSETAEGRRVIPVTVENEMKSSYIDYAMSVIIGRAIPDIRDGLKPVHRRILYGMWEMGNTHDKPTKKSASIVGHVMGKYHPHGDAAIYDTMVKMAQPFSYRYMPVEGQGNFGSIDGDSAAAMRYTEARLTPLAEGMLDDIDKETVDFTPNFDESTKEPTVLPGKMPNLLLNGSSGIAVGMATNMPPHNLREVCDALYTYIDDPGVTVDELMHKIPAPDFPGGGVIMGTAGVRSAYLTGRGKCVVRGVAEIEEEGKHPRIIITEIPFQVNKANLVEQIANLVKDKRIEGITDIRDESDKDGIRVVIDLRRDAMPQVVLNQLYKHTPLESTFGINNLAIVNGRPMVLGLPALLGHFLDHRVEVVRRRTEFDLRKAQERVHVLNGLALALQSIDDVVAAIRASKSAEDAREALITRFGLDEIQANAILQMQLRRLAALEQQKVLDEREALGKEIRRLQEILSDRTHILEEIKKEVAAIREEFGDERRTQISVAEGEISKADLIEDKPALVSLTATNYIKRLPLETYRQQRRGGRGVIGMTTKEDDVVTDVFVAATHDYLLCFTNLGRLYWMRVWDIPEAVRTGKGKAIVNLLNLSGEERVTTIIPTRDFEPGRFLFFATKGGMAVKIPLEEFSRPRPSGILAIKLKEGDELVDVKITDGKQDVFLTTRKGQSLRFNEDEIRSLHRNSQGVIGIRLRPEDCLVSLALVEKDYLLTVTGKGAGKLIVFDEFMGHHRGTMGARNIRPIYGDKVVAARAVSADDEIILMSTSGIAMRTRVSEISIQKRDTRGVRVMKMGEGDQLVGFAIVQIEEEN